jgi:hypothetical protein
LLRSFHGLETAHSIAQSSRVFRFQFCSTLTGRKHLGDIDFAILSYGGNVRPKLTVDGPIGDFAERTVHMNRREFPRLNHRECFACGPERVPRRRSLEQRLLGVAEYLCGSLPRDPGEYQIFRSGDEERGADQRASPFRNLCCAIFFF